jgi:hypothetical protein
LALANMAWSSVKRLTVLRSRSGFHLDGAVAHIAIPLVIALMPEPTVSSGRSDAGSVRDAMNRKCATSGALGAEALRQRTSGR